MIVLIRQWRAACRYFELGTLSWLSTSSCCSHERKFLVYGFGAPGGGLKHQGAVRSNASLLVVFWVAKSCNRRNGLRADKLAKLCWLRSTAGGVTFGTKLQSRGPDVQ